MKKIIKLRIIMMALAATIPVTAQEKSGKLFFTTAFGLINPPWHSVRE